MLPPGVSSAGKLLLMSFSPPEKLVWLVTSQASAKFLQGTRECLLAVVLIPGFPHYREASVGLLLKCHHFFSVLAKLGGLGALVLLETKKPEKSQPSH